MEVVQEELVQVSYFVCLVSTCLSLFLCCIVFFFCCVVLCCLVLSCPVVYCVVCCVVLCWFFVCCLVLSFVVLYCLMLSCLCFYVCLCSVFALSRLDGDRAFNSSLNLLPILGYLFCRGCCGNKCATEGAHVIYPYLYRRRLWETHLNHFLTAYPKQASGLLKQLGTLCPLADSKVGFVPAFCCVSCKDIGFSTSILLPHPHPPL